ncbi:hypothetical protein DRH14_00950 [Candidatus Shapirobacteria bacterium]|nr:MAG: hypothetical protein DRH14_00950 [Candidatus Shapirobacteria bacterium]
MPQLNPDQIKQLQSLGIYTPTKNTTNSNHKFLPLLSISGLTLLSFGGLILFKQKNNFATPIPTPISSQNFPNPTQTPKSIQHYLLASQQFFSQALQQQQQDHPSQPKIASLLNQSILEATQAIKNFPQDYRSWQQRASIYQALIDSQPQFINQAISDFSKAFQLNPQSASIAKNLASLFAKKGDATNTLRYLSKTTVLEPTKAQNFYDLAKIQQQTGLLSQAIQTYQQLIPLVSDPQQKTQLVSQKKSLEKLVAQAKQSNSTTSQKPSPHLDLPSLSPATDDSPLLQATNTSDTGLIIASPRQDKKISLDNINQSNALSGQSTLPANQTTITIQNSQLKTSSQVYLTITKGGKNQSLQLISKSADSFVVGLNTPYPQNIEFKWWIVN